MAATSISPPEFPFDLLRPDIAKVESHLEEQIKAFDPAVEGYIAYICRSSGKRIRPALVLLAGGATGGSTEDHIRLGTILEMIHVATLVHDDIIDGAQKRRNLITANARWGNGLSVLLGDCLFAHALMLSSEFEDAAIPKKIARAANRVCMGEIMQTQRRFDLQLTKEDYFRIIEMKTAELFAVSGELGARLNQQPDHVTENLEAFGRKLGIAYQIYDDCLDLVGEEGTVGKTLRTDLERGKLTLPILNLLEEASDKQHEKLSRILLQKEPFDVSALANIADYEGALERALGHARTLLNEARAHLIVLDGGPHAAAMTQVTHFLDGLLDRCQV
ncbi:MAG: polyprenyl synthetase family protein [Verrucomicrobiota bacterium]